MGGEATIVVDGPPVLFEIAERRVGDLEHKWSRFLGDSEISRLNADRTATHVVSADTRTLVRKAEEAWRASEGAFDPTIIDAIVTWGYDVDFPDIEIRHRPDDVPDVPGLGSIAVDDDAGTVCLGGVGFDPGGIGKGLAADLVATELVEHGATAALVDLGGDLRLAGSPDPGWAVGIEDPGDPPNDLRRVTITGGGMATSSDRRRRWRSGQHEVHHLIDPATGRPKDSILSGVTVLAGEAWWAEALTCAVLVGGFPIADLGSLGASAIGRRRDEVVVGTADLIGLDGTAA